MPIASFCRGTTANTGSKCRNSRFAITRNSTRARSRPRNWSSLSGGRSKFLAASLIDSLKSNSKIFVYLQRPPVTDSEFDAFRAALASYGPATLLWVAASDRTHPPDSVELLDEPLMGGDLRRLARPQPV